MQNNPPVSVPGYISASAEASAQICQYPFIKIRSDMAYGEFNKYKSDWYTFNRVWSYNYVIRKLNAAGGKYSYYIFSDSFEHASYKTGQDNHVSMYPSAGAAGVFNNIP
jgi:hypothetical protein